MADVQMKVPVLNNMAQCMIKKELWERAKDLLEEVLKLEPKNAKATNRKLTCMLKLNMIAKLETDVPYIRNTLETYSEGNKATDVNELKKYFVS